MVFKRKKNRILTLVLGVCIVASLTGCGGNGEYVSKAMELIKAVDYQGALTELDNAEENGENRLRDLPPFSLPPPGHRISCNQMLPP